MPAFLTIALMPMTYSIATGISFGIISYTLVKTLSGRAFARSIRLMFVLTLLLLAFYGNAGEAGEMGRPTVVSLLAGCDLLAD